VVDESQSGPICPYGLTRWLLCQSPAVDKISKIKVLYLACRLLLVDC